MYVTLALLAVLAVAMLAQAADAGSAEPGDALIYRKVDSVELKLHRFNPEGWKPSDNRPAVVFFFGGGWKQGNPSQFFPQSRYLAQRGMVAFSAEYRTQAGHDAPPSACVKDAKAAVRYIRANAAQLGVDPQRIVAGGGSAGGHLAAAAAFVTGFNDDPEAEVSCKPDALALFNPVIDNSAQGYGYDRVKDYWQAFSPAHNISNNPPPCIFFLGSEDSLIPVATAERFKQDIEQAGGYCELYITQGAAHGFFNAPDVRQVTLRQLDAFLVKLGYLQAKGAKAQPQPLP